MFTYIQCVCQSSPKTVVINDWLRGVVRYGTKNKQTGKKMKNNLPAIEMIEETSSLSETYDLNDIKHKKILVDRYIDGNFASTVYINKFNYRTRVCNYKLPKITIIDEFDDFSDILNELNELNFKDLVLIKKIKSKLYCIISDLTIHNKCDFLCEYIRLMGCDVIRFVNCKLSDDIIERMNFDHIQLIKCDIAFVNLNEMQGILEVENSVINTIFKIDSNMSNIQLQLSDKDCNISLLFDENSIEVKINDIQYDLSSKLYYLSSQLSSKCDKISMIQELCFRERNDDDLTKYLMNIQKSLQLKAFIDKLFNNIMEDMFPDEMMEVEDSEMIIDIRNDYKKRVIDKINGDYKCLYEYFKDMLDKRKSLSEARSKGESALRGMYKILNMEDEYWLVSFMSYVSIVGSKDMEDKLKKIEHRLNIFQRLYKDADEKLYNTLIVDMNVDANDCDKFLETLSVDILDIKNWSNVRDCKEWIDICLSLGCRKIICNNKNLEIQFMKQLYLRDKVPGNLLLDVSHILCKYPHIANGESFVQFCESLLRIERFVVMADDKDFENRVNKYLGDRSLCKYFKYIPGEIESLINKEGHLLWYEVKTCFESLQRLENEVLISKLILPDFMSSAQRKVKYQSSLNFVVLRDLWVENDRDFLRELSSLLDIENQWTIRLIDCKISGRIARALLSNKCIKRVLLENCEIDFLDFTSFHSHARLSLLNYFSSIDINNKTSIFIEFIGLDGSVFLNISADNSHLYSGVLDEHGDKHNAVRRFLLSNFSKTDIAKYICGLRKFVVEFNPLTASKQCLKDRTNWLRTYSSIIFSASNGRFVSLLYNHGIPKLNLSSLPVDFFIKSNEENVVLDHDMLNQVSKAYCDLGINYIIYKDNSVIEYMINDGILKITANLNKDKNK